MRILHIVALIATIAIIAVLIRAGPYLSKRIGSGGATTSVPITIGPTTTGNYSIGNSSNMIFGALLGKASYSGLEKNSGQLIEAELQMLASTGISLVRIDVNFQPWLYNNTADIQKLDGVASNISSNGEKLCIADSSSESYRQNPLPWVQFKQAWINRVKVLAARYHPYCYIVVKEPGWYYPMIADFPFNLQIFNASQWANLTSQLALAVKNVSPNTLVGVAVPGNIYHESTQLDYNYMRQAGRIEGVDFLGFDIYGLQGYNDTARFLNQTGRNGKDVWIAETWSALETKAFNASRSQTDVQWINSLYNFSLGIRAGAVIPFFTSIFSTYQRNATIQQFQQNRTPVYYAYKQIISAAR